VCVRTRLAVIIALFVALLVPWGGSSPSRAQTPTPGAQPPAPGQKATVIIDILGTPGKKINIAIPEFTIV